MERVFVNLIIALGLIGYVGLADAQVLLVRPSADLALDDEAFPESRFGQAPADPITRKIRMPASVKPSHKNASGLVTSKNGVQETSMILTPTGMYPPTLFVTVDVPVRLFVTSVGKENLCVMIDEFGIRKQVPTQKIEELSFVPKSTGVYRMHCPVKGIEASLVVREPWTPVPEKGPNPGSDPVASAPVQKKAVRIPASDLENAPLKADSEEE